MALYALEDVDDALDVTRDLLTPIDRTLWAKLAFVVFFVGGPGANFNSFQYSFGGDGGGGQVPGQGIPPTVGPRFWLLIAGIIGVVLLVALFFALIGSIMEFVFVESLRNEAVTIRRYWSRRWKQGVRLFAFRFLLGVFVLGIALLFVAPFILAVAGVEGIGGGVSIAFVLLLLPVFLLLSLVVGLVNGFTTVFVVPIMILEDCNVLAGWRRLWPTITAQWQQYLAYAVGGFVLSLVGGVFVAIAGAVLVVLLLIPFGVLFALGFGAFLLVEPLGIGLLILLAVLFVLAVLAVLALVQMPVQTYLRYYALLVLGDVDPDLDLIPDQRASVRD